MMNRLVKGALLASIIVTGISCSGGALQQNRKLANEILNDSSVNRKLALKIGMDGVKRIDRQLIVRSKVALKTVEIAKSEGKDLELIEQLYKDAFE